VGPTARHLRCGQLLAIRSLRVRRFPFAPTTCGGANRSLSARRTFVAQDSQWNLRHLRCGWLLGTCGAAGGSLVARSGFLGSYPCARKKAQGRDFQDDLVRRSRGLRIQTRSPPAPAVRLAARCSLALGVLARNSKGAESGLLERNLAGICTVSGAAKAIKRRIKRHFCTRLVAKLKNN